MISRDTQPGGTRESAAPKDDEWLFRRCRLRRSRNRRRLPDGITPRIQYPRALADEAEARQPLGAAPFSLAVTEREQRAERGFLAETAQNRMLPAVSRTAMRQTISSGSRGS